MTEHSSFSRTAEARILDHSFNTIGRDCLKLIFSELDVPTLCRLKRVSKRCKNVAEDVLGITRVQPEIDCLSHEIVELQAVLEAKKDLLYKAQLKQSIKLLSSQELQRRRLKNVIEKYNAFYANIEAKVNPDFVLQDLSDIKFFTVYAHVANCLESPFLGERCCCPLQFMYLTFFGSDNLDRDRRVSYSGSYDITRSQPFNGYFEYATLADFNGRLVLTGGWNTQHMIEHIVYRVLSTEIKIRKLNVGKTAKAVRKHGASRSDDDSDSDGNELWYELWEEFQESANGGDPVTRGPEDEHIHDDDVVYDEQRGEAWVRLPQDLLQQLQNVPFENPDGHDLQENA